MATIPKTGIVTGQAITAAQILNIIEALDGTDATDIVLDGIVTLNGVTQANTGTNVLTIDGSGRVYKTGSYSAGGSGPSGVTSFTNTNGTFISAGTANSSATGAVTMGTIDLSASGTKNINTVLRGDNTFGTPVSSSFSISSSRADSAVSSDTATSSSHSLISDNSLLATTASFVLTSSLALSSNTILIRKGVKFDNGSTYQNFNITGSENQLITNGDDITIKAGDGGQATILTNTKGGRLFLGAGDGSSNSATGPSFGGDVIIKAGDSKSTIATNVGGGDIALIAGNRVGTGEVGKVLVGATSNFSESVSLTPDLNNEPGLEVSGSIVILQNDGNSSLYFTANSDTQLQAGIQYIDKGLNFWTPFGSDGGSANYSLFISSSGGIGMGKQPGLGFSQFYGGLELANAQAGKPNGGSWINTTSDERVKENITTASLDRCYEVVKSIPLKRYRWKDSTYSDEEIGFDRHTLGWIAQDVQPYFPKAVKTGSFTTLVTYTGSSSITGSDGLNQIIHPGDKVRDVLAGSKQFDNMLSLDETQMMRMLYGTVQKLQQKVEALEAQINGEM